MNWKPLVIGAAFTIALQLGIKKFLPSVAATLGL